jgi:hypothetical protein
MPHVPLDPIPFEVGYEIDATFMPRIAAQDTLRCHHRASRRAMHLQGLDRVFAAAWPKAAMRSDKRAKRPLIYTDDANPKLSRGRHTPVLSNARLISPCKAMKFRFRVLSRPINTKSTPVTGRCANTSRAASFSRRRVRLRTTAFPTFLVTVKPSLAGKSSARGSAWRTTPPIAAFLPADATRKNSARRLSRANFLVGSVAVADFPAAEFRSTRGSVEAGMVGTPALGGSGGQLLAALGSPVGQDLATANGLHAGAKSVPALADQLGRLIGALHDDSPKTI